MKKIIGSLLAVVLIFVMSFENMVFAYGENDSISTELIKLEILDTENQEIEVGKTRQKVNIAVSNNDFEMQYQYRFSVFENYNEESNETGKEILLEDYSTNAVCEWIPELEGSYKIKVESLNNEGEKIVTEKPFIVLEEEKLESEEGIQAENLEVPEINVETIEDITTDTVSSKPLSINDFLITPTGGSVVGNSINLMCNATGGVGDYQYRFYVLREGKEIQLRKYGQENSYEWTPATPAEYIVGVQVKDGDGTVVEKKIMNYVVKNQGVYVAEFKAYPENEVLVGDYVDLSTKAEGNSGACEYQFYVVRNDQEIQIRKYGRENTYQWKPMTPAKYTLGVRVKDIDGTVVKKEITNYIVKSQGLYVAEFKVSPKNEVLTGNYVDLSTKVEGNSGACEYQFYVVRNGQEIQIRKYGRENTYQWKPMTPAKYTLGVRVKDSDGTVVEKKIENYVVKNQSLSIEDFKVSPQGETLVGGSVELVAKSTGGTGNYEYQFYVIRNGQEIQLRKYGTENSYVWLPVTPAKYTLGVRIKDSSGSIVEKQIANYSVKKGSLEIREFTVSPQNEEIAGNPVELTSKVEGGVGDYKYEFYAIRNGKEIQLRKYMSENSYQWKPMTPSEYTLGVRVKDAVGTIVTKEIAQYKIKTPPVKITSFESYVKDVVGVGQSTILSVKHSSSVAPYSYRFYVIRDGYEIELCKYGTSSTYEWTPRTPSNYTVCVDIKDGEGNVVTGKIPIIVKKYEVKINKLQVGNDISALTGQSVYLYTEASEGYGEYEYRYYVIRNGQEIQLRDFGKSNIYIWNPITPADYQVCVEVKDALGNTTIEQKNFKVKQSNFTISSFTMSKIGKAHKGDNITLTAHATGGSGRYQYKFYVIRNNQEIVIRNYSSSNTYIWAPVTLADYIVCVDVKDENNNIITTQMQQITIEEALIRGIDVSKWQGNVNWSSVKQSGISFAMIRVLQGTMSNMEVDSQFYSNIKNASKNGIPVGVYRYGYAMTPSQAQKEAIATVNALKTSGYSITYPVAYDVEDSATQGTLSKAQLTEVIKAYKGVIENHGYKFMIYSSKSWLENKIDMNSFSDVDVWIARWFYDGSPYHDHGYRGPGKVTLWQYSDCGSVPGINGPVDMNISYKRY